MKRLMVIALLGCSSEKTKPEPVPPLDCAKVIVPADVATACNVPIEQVATFSDDLEKHASESCSVALTVNGKVAVGGSFNAGQKFAVRALFEHEKLDGEKPVTAGDMAALGTHTVRDKVRHELRVAKNTVHFKLLADEPSACNDDQLIALAKAIADRF